MRLPALPALPALSLLALPLVGLLALAPSSAQAADFYVDPETGSPGGDGSADDPWQTLQQVVDDGLIETRHWASLPYEEGATLETVNEGAPVQAGDTIWLRSGYHGDVQIEGAYNEAPITIAAEEGHTPTLRRLLLRAASNWVVRGLSISPSYAPEFERVTMVDIDNHGWQGPSHDIVVEDCELFSVDDISGWSASDWVDDAVNGFQVDGDRVEIRRNLVRNVDFGISVGGEEAIVSRNEIVNFSGDGLRGLGDYGVFQYNVVKNAYDVDDNHDDGFQSWSNGPDGVGTGEVVGVVLRGNVIINYEDPDQPLRSTLQGIGCFDGFFVDWVVENNVIITDHWHGITLLGARNSRIVNNTVIDPNDSDPGPPWVQIGPHKDDTPSEGSVVRNNLTTSVNVPDGQDVTVDNNIEVSDYAAHFVDAAGYDLHLLESSGAVDSGSDELAPAIDRDRIPRPQGDGVDVGAYEWHEGDVMPVDGGVGGTDAGMPGDDGGVDRDAGGARDGGGSADAGGSVDAGGEGSGGGDGCGCASAGGAAGGWLPVLLGLAWLVSRRSSANRPTRKRRASRAGRQSSRAGSRGARRPMRRGRSSTAARERASA